MRLSMLTSTPVLLIFLAGLLSLIALSVESLRAADRPASRAQLGRSPVLATQGMVATSQPLAAAAGLRVLQMEETPSMPPSPRPPYSMSSSP